MMPVNFPDGNALARDKSPNQIQVVVQTGIDADSNKPFTAFMWVPSLEDLNELNNGGRVVIVFFSRDIPSFTACVTDVKGNSI